MLTRYKPLQDKYLVLTRSHQATKTLGHNELPESHEYSRHSRDSLFKSQSLSAALFLVSLVSLCEPLFGCGRRPRWALGGFKEDLDSRPLFRVRRVALGRQSFAGMTGKRGRRVAPGAAGGLGTFCFLGKREISVEFLVFAQHTGLDKRL
jgi:hypothetical protein